MRRQRLPPAKITRPAISRVYLRKRLFRLLDEGRGYKAIWINGPPGSGKTTLVSSYIEAKNIPCIWFQVDSGDRDPATFFHYLALAAKGLAPGRRKPLPHFTPEYRGGLLTFARNFFHEMFRRMPNPSLLVLDNLQEASDENPPPLNPLPQGEGRLECIPSIPPPLMGGGKGEGDKRRFSDESGFLDLLCAGLAEAPEGCCTILISRNAPSPAYARSCVNREMKTVGGEDLRLTDEEFAGLAKVLGYKIGNREKVSHLQKAIQGWAAGLILLIERFKAGMPDKECLLRGIADHRVFDYFMREIFEKTNPETQCFLMKTSLLPEMTGEMARELTGNEESHRILQQLDSQRFFVYSSSHSATVYQYHPLFKEFLQSSAEGYFNSEEFNQVQGKAAHILKKSGYTEDAAGLFIRTGDWDGLRDLILEHAASLISQGRYQVLESWLAAIPSELIKHSPWLLYYLGLCRMPQNPALARVELEAAYKLFKERGKNIIPPPSTGLFLSWSAIVDTFLYEWNDFKPLDFWIEEFERLTAEFPEFPSRAIEEHIVSSIFGALMFRQPQNPRIHYWEERAMTIVQDSPDVTRKFSIGHNLIFYYCWMGNMDRADFVVKILLPVFKRCGDISLSYLMFLRAYALYHCYTASPGTAQSLAEEGLRLGETAGIRLLDNMFLMVGIYSSYLMGDMNSAGRYFNMVTFEKDRLRSFTQGTYHLLGSIKALHFNGSISSAVEHAKLCLKHTEELGSPLLINQHRFVFANALLEIRKYDASQIHIEGIRKVNGAIRSSFHEYLCLLGESLMALKKGDNDIFVEKFRGAMVLSRSYDIPFFGYLCLSSAALLCAKALEGGVEVEYVREIIRRNSLTSCYTPDPGIEEWPWPIKIYTLGRFEIWREDKRVEFPRKVQKKTLSLLKLLIATGGKAIPEESIIDTLWPDADGDQAGHSFTTALWRLRKLIGSDKAILYRDGQVSLNRQQCWVDIWSFGYLLRQSEEAAKGGHVDRGFQFLRKAIGMYRGHFLTCDAEEPWTLSQRERLRDRFIMAISRLGKHLEERGEIDEAIDCYNRGIATDDLAERLYQRLMLCHQRMGNRTEAIKIYKRLKTLLSIHLGVEPSRETEGIYKSILCP